MKILNSCPFHLESNKTRILWEITSRCNMFCKHCLFFQNNQTNIQKELSTDEVYRIIDNISKDKSINAIWLSRRRTSFKKRYC